MAEQLERWTCDRRHRFQVPPRPLAGFVHGSPVCKSSAMLVNSQLIHLLPAGILIGSLSLKNPIRGEDNSVFIQVFVHVTGSN